MVWHLRVESTSMPLPNIRSGNEKQVGEAIRDSGIPRNEIYLTTKLAYVSLSINILQSSY